MTKHDEWSKETQVNLFAHNHMRHENAKIDTLDKAPGTGVGGRMLDFLRVHGFQTSSNMVDQYHSIFVRGSPFYSNPAWNVNIKNSIEIDNYSTLGLDMFDLVKLLNGKGESGNSLFVDTFSKRITQGLYEYEKGLEYDELMSSSEFNMNQYPRLGSDIHLRLRAIAQYIKMRGKRKVNRDSFIVRQPDFDTHSEAESFTGSLFSDANKALEVFMEEMKRQGLWDDTVIVMGSDFGRSISNNGSGGTDHAWGGNYFMIGGSVNGGKILGKYPDYLSKKDNHWVGRGILIPTTPWESVWNGVATWMGVRGDNSLDTMLPNRDNFDKCSMFTDQDLFNNGQVPHSSCSSRDGDGDGVPDKSDQCPNTQYSDIDKVNSIGCLEGETGAPTTNVVPTESPNISPTKSPNPTNPPIPTDNPTPSPTHTPTDTPDAVRLKCRFSYYMLHCSFFSNFENYIYSKLTYLVVFTSFKHTGMRSYRGGKNWKLFKPRP